MAKNKWTKLAADCYHIGCRCSMCNLIPDYIKPRCRVKKSVIELVRLFGKPATTYQ